MVKDVRQFEELVRKALASTSAASWQEIDVLINKGRPHLTIPSGLEELLTNVIEDTGNV